ncbi:MAG: hypothetical protein HW385_772 [candidate division NC10 bacterium]|nr:hypothetical protein [candidate division NC10 bacterium]
MGKNREASLGFNNRLNRSYTAIQLIPGYPDVHESPSPVEGRMDTTLLLFYMYKT